MYQTLDAFYNGKEWRAFRAKYIGDMLDRSGKIYSELSGEIILNDYDAVLHHHKTELTIQNVNDFSISLNPENVILITRKEHNEEHHRFGFQKQKRVYYVYGAPCSGKTTYINKVKGNSDIVIDIDNIWQCVTGGQRYEKPKALNQNVFEIRDLLYDMIRKRAGNWENAYVIAGGAVRGIREREIASFGAEAVYIDTDKETCIKRLYADTTRTPAQKAEWVKYIDRWFNDYTA